MSGLITALGLLVAALAVVGGIYQLFATVLAARFLGRRQAPVASLPAVTVVKPLHGAYRGMEEVLIAFCDQDYPAPVQIVFGVHDLSDPAVAVVASLRARRPEADIELVVDGAKHGANGKVSNLINIARRAKHDVLVLSDADIVVGADYLTRVATALAGDGVGAVTCLYVGKSDAAPWSRLGAMAISYGFLPNAILGKALGMAQPCFGSTIALTRETLGRIGGFAAFADHLADDYEIGRAVRALGLTVAIPPMVVSHLCMEADGPNLIAHELRWGRTVRQIDPAGYAGSLITYPLPLAMLAWALLGCPPLAAGLILIILEVRLACKLAMDAATGRSAGRWWMIPARDVLSFGVFVASFAVNTVGWQGQRFRVGPDGALIHS